MSKQFFEVEFRRVRYQRVRVVETAFATIASCSEEQALEAARSMRDRTIDAVFEESDEESEVISSVGGEVWVEGATPGRRDRVTFSAAKILARV